MTQALEQYRALGDRQGEGNVIANLGLVHHFRCEYEQALEYHQLGLQLEQNQKNSSQNQPLQTNGEAARYLLDEFTDSRQIGTKRSWASVQYNLGVNYYWLNHYVLSLDHYQLSLKVIRQLGDCKNECLLLSQIGEVYFYLGNYNKAIAYHQQNLHIGRKIDSDMIQGISLNSLANVYSMLNQLDESIRHYEQALFYAKQMRSTIRGMPFQDWPSSML